MAVMPPRRSIMAKPCCSVCVCVCVWRQVVHGAWGVGRGVCAVWRQVVRGAWGVCVVRFVCCVELEAMVLCMAQRIWRLSCSLPR
jgi:hypothetical protein